LTGLGQKARAQADFEKAVASPDCGHVVYKFLEDIYKDQGRLDKAIVVCDLQIKREPNEETYRRKGELLLLKKDYAGARQALTKAIGYAPFNYRNFELRGDTNLASGAAKEAVADYTKALSLEPYFPAEIYQNRAKAYAMLGQRDLAQKDRQSSLAKD
jgi:tetratricopeptide (TPR) repeat protein